MATFYSSFFSSGFLAPNAQSAPSTTPRPPSPTTPRPSRASLLPDETTPTATLGPSISLPDESQVLPSISVATPDDSRPRLRKRRSSLAGATSSLTTMKTSGPMRQAAASAHRSLRARSGSDASILSTTSGASTLGAATLDPPPNKSSPKPLPIVGRLRSGSLGTALRTRRGLRRSVPSISAPPPTAPLPAVPPLSGYSSSPTSPLPTVQTPTNPVTPRRPLTRRSQTCNNYDLSSSPFSVAGSSPMCIVETEDAFAAALHVSTPLLGKGCENEMQVDYPSPVDGTVFEWGRAQN